MRQELVNMLEEVTAKYRNNSRLSPAQLEYMAAKSLLDALREQAEKEYMSWDGNDETLEAVAAHDVAVDQKYGVYEAEEHYKGKKDNLIAWSQKMAVKIARKHGTPERVIQEIIEMHQNINKHPVQRRKLIDAALKLNAR